MKRGICVLFAGLLLSPGEGLATILELPLLPVPGLPAPGPAASPGATPENMLFLLQNPSPSWDHAAKALQGDRGLSEGQNSEALFQIDLFGLDDAGPRRADSLLAVP